MLVCVFTLPIERSVANRNLQSVSQSGGRSSGVFFFCHSEKLIGLFVAGVLRAHAYMFTPGIAKAKWISACAYSWNAEVAGL